MQDKPINDLPVDGDLAKRLIGKYEMAEGKVEITAEDDKLYATLNGEPRDRLKYQGNQEFISSNDPNLRITFTPPEGQAKGFDVDAEGQKLSGRRAD